MAPLPRAMMHRLVLPAVILVLFAVLLWIAAAPVVAVLVERQLRAAGWTNPSVTDVSLDVAGVTLGRVRLAGEAFELEDVRARVAFDGIRSLSISRLRLDADLSEDGNLVLPGIDSSGDGGPPVELVPVGGVRLAQGEVRLATGAGLVVLSLSDLTAARRGATADVRFGYAIDLAGAHLEGAATAEVDADGASRVRLELAGGNLEAGALEATGVTGEAIGTLPAQGDLTVRLDVETDATVLAGIAIGAIAVQADWREGGARLDVRSLDSAAADLAVEGRIDLVEGAPSFDLSGRLLLDGADAQGEVVVDAEGVASAEDGAPGFRGSLRLAARGLSIDGRFRDGSVDLAAGLDSVDEQWRITAADDWTAQLTPDASWLPLPLHALAGETLSVSIEPRADAPLVLQLEPAGKSAQVDIPSLTVRAGEASLDAAARVSASSAGGLEVRAEALQMSVERLPWADIVLHLDGFEGSANYASEGWQATGEGRVAADGSVGPARIEGLAARWSGTVAGTPQDVRLVPDACIDWSVGAIEYGGRRLAQLSPPCLRAIGGEALLTYDAEEASTTFAVATAEGPLEALLGAVQGEGPDGSADDKSVSGTWPSLSITGAADAEGLKSLTARGSNGVLQLPQERLAIEGIDGSVEMQSGALVSASLQVTSIKDLRTPPAWVPVGLEARAASDTNGLSFDALLSDDLGIFAFEAAGRYTDGRATAELTLYPLRFISGATEIADLSPMLGEHVENASGTVEFHGEVEWTGGELTGTGSLRVEDLGADVGGIPFAGVSGTTRFDALFPPATPADQTLQIARIDLGVPLESGVAVYELVAGDRLTLQNLRFDFAGGRLFAEPFTVDSAELGEISFVLHAEEVELSQMLALSRIEGLQGTGVLSGRVPVSISEQGLRIDGGILAAETDGTLRYTPDNLPAFLQGDDLRSEMLREVLTNFQYRELSVSIGSESGESGDSPVQRLSLNAQGANPDFLEGHPIELNFNLQGPLLGVVQSAVDIAGGQEIQQMFEQQEREDEEIAQ